MLCPSRLTPRPHEPTNSILPIPPTVRDSVQWGNPIGLHGKCARYAYMMNRVGLIAYNTAYPIEYLLPFSVVVLNVSRNSIEMLEPTVSHVESLLLIDNSEFCMISKSFIPAVLVAGQAQNNTDPRVIVHSKCWQQVPMDPNYIAYS